MKVVIILCLVALALAYDDYRRPYKGSVRYNYNIDYSKWPGRQGKAESIDPSGTRGSYYADLPKSNTHVSYDFPKNHHNWLLLPPPPG